MFAKVGDAYPWAGVPRWGSRVRLNSGGPEMLIVDFEDEATGVCVTAWMDGGCEREAVFDYRCLRPA